MLVFSLTLEASLREVTALRQQILRIKGENSVSCTQFLRTPNLPRFGDRPLMQRVPMVLVGTKLDLTNEREVSRSTLEELSARWEIPVYETSAKRNWDVTEAFQDLVRQMLQYYPPNERPKKKARMTHRDRLRRRSRCVIM